MSRKREEINEEEEDEDYTICEIKKDIMREMRKYSKLSDEYRVLAQRLTEITECERNETQTMQTVAQKWSWIVPTVVQSVSTAINTAVSYSMNRKTVNDVLHHEDNGYIITSKSQNYIKKP